MTTTSPQAPPLGMIAIPGGTFAMGSTKFYPEERPARRVRVRDFWIDRTPVTNAAFAAFIAATGYRTVAEIPPDPADYPGMAPELAVAGSLVFHRTDRPVPLDNPAQWWSFVPGADSRPAFYWRQTVPGSGTRLSGTSPSRAKAHGETETMTVRACAASGDACNTALYGVDCARVGCTDRACWEPYNPRLGRSSR